MKVKIKEKVFDYAEFVSFIIVLLLFITFIYLPLLIYFSSKDINWLYIQVFYLSSMFGVFLIYSIRNILGITMNDFYVTKEKIVEVRKVRKGDSNKKERR